MKRIVEINMKNMHILKLLLKCVTKRRYTYKSQLKIVIFLLLITVLVVIIYILFADEIINLDENLIYNEKLRYYKNHNWMYNVNIMQFCSYIVLSTRSNSIYKYRIESMILLNNEKITDAKIDEIKCLIRSIQNDQVLKVKVSAMHKLVLNYIRKIVCIYETNLPLQFNEITVAIVIESDFSSDNMKKDWLESSNNFPFEMINYQWPSYVDATKPRLPQVALCLQYVSTVYPGILNWLKMQQDFGLSSIIMHDGSKDKSLKKLINGKINSNFVEIREYNFDYENICKTKQIEFQRYKFRTKSRVYLNKCKRFYKIKFYNYDGNHNHITANDCYIQYGYKYEYVALYDLDELIVPRTLSSVKMFNEKKLFSCMKDNQVCNEIKPISIGMYEYIQRVLKQQSINDVSHLRSIAFSHAAYIIPNEMQAKLMNNLKELSIKIQNNVFKKKDFPLKLAFYRHIFTINEDDILYVQYLVDSYESFSCYYSNYLSKMHNFDKNFLRFIYILTLYDQRFPKSIHYSKNVYTLFTHDAWNYVNESFIVYLNASETHTSPHFRVDPSQFFAVKLENSIRSLAIDHEYIFYLLKNNTDYCSSVNLV